MPQAGSIYKFSLRRLLFFVVFRNTPCSLLKKGLVPYLGWSDLRSEDNLKSLINNKGHHPCRHELKHRFTKGPGPAS